MKNPLYIVVIDVAPRSKKRTAYIAKLRDEGQPVYETWAKCTYASEAYDRVLELNKSCEEASRG